MTRRTRRHLPLLAVVLLNGAAAFAQEPAPDVNALAKQTQNPVGDLVSVPLQFNFNTGGDLEERTLFNLNLQPVIPFSVTSSWKLILRTIVPINSFPAADAGRSSGVGDVQAQAFFTAARPGPVVWGIGPVFSLPTATTGPAETGTWAGGIGGVIVKNAGPWVLGSLVSQLWPIADAGDRPRTDLLTIQPFVNYNLGDGWALSLSPVMTANWDADSGEQWTVPLGFGVTRTTVFNGRPMNLGVQYYYNVEHPQGGPGQQLRFVVALLYPSARK